RPESERFADVACATLNEHGIDVLRLPRPSPTPFVAWGTPRLSAAFGLVVTASHNPAGYNGLKVFTPSGAQVAPPARCEDGGGDPRRAGRCRRRPPREGHRPRPGRWISASGLARVRDDLGQGPSRRLYAASRRRSSAAPTPLRGSRNRARGGPVPGLGRRSVLHGPEPEPRRSTSPRRGDLARAERRGGSRPRARPRRGSTRCRGALAR
ncbi:MAG: hypothetical protein HC923_10175, partial [Myxococcales bacterium]|nr:hypothetical protein [Myxococcales bacterium]